MKKLIPVLMLFAISMLLTGCAAYYRPIYPPALNYNNLDVAEGISFSYKYDVLRERGNKKYSKKELRKGIKLVAVKITNNYDTTLNIGRDIVFYSGQDRLNIVDPYICKQLLKQSVPGYFLYLLFTPLQFGTTDNYGRIIESYPIGLALGPGLTAINTITAANANSKLSRELYEYDIMNRDIRAGETQYGIIGVRDSGFNPITVKLMYQDVTEGTYTE